jgi:phage terminase large subunit-like protein
MTPRPTTTVQAILKRKGMVLTTGTTYENRENLAEDFFTEIITNYEGTRLGRQELMGELLNALEGALWNHKQLDDLRVEFDEKREYRRVVVAIDPPASDGPSSAECGIIVAGVGLDGHAYVIADRSLKGSPAEWAAAAWRTADEFDADALVFEINQGGAMVRHTLQTARPKNGKPRRMIAVRATKGKILRAEPVAALYEQGRVHHVETLPQLEDQMCSYLPEEQAQRRKADTGEGQVSPDRLDALVYGVSNLMIGRPVGYTF